MKRGTLGVILFVLELPFAALAEHDAAGLASKVSGGTSLWQGLQGNVSLDTSGVTSCVYLDNEYVANILRIDYLVVNYLQRPVSAPESREAQDAIQALEKRNRQLKEMMAKANDGQPCFPGGNVPHPYQRTAEQTNLLNKTLVAFPSCTRPCESKTEGDIRAEGPRVVSLGEGCYRCTAEGPGLVAGVQPSAQCGSQADAAAAAYLTCAAQTGLPLNNQCKVNNCLRVPSAVCQHVSGQNTVTDSYKQYQHTVSYYGISIWVGIHSTGGASIVPRQEKLNLNGTVTGEVKFESEGAPFCKVGETFCHGSGKITCTASRAQAKVVTKLAQLDLFGNGGQNLNEETFQTDFSTKWTFATDASIDLASAHALCSKWLNNQAAPQIQKAMEEKIKAMGLHWVIKPGQCIIASDCGEENPYTMPVCRNSLCLRLSKDGQRCDQANQATVPFPSRVSTPETCLSGICEQDTVKSLLPPGEPVFFCVGPYFGNRRDLYNKDKAIALRGTTFDGQPRCFDRANDVKREKEGYAYTHTCHDGQNQKLTMVQAADDPRFFSLVGDNGSCLDVHPGESAGPRGKGKKVYMHTDCHLGDNQQFRRYPSGEIVSRRFPWLCLDISSDAVGGDGNKLYMYPCNKQVNQVWNFVQ